MTTASTGPTRPEHLEHVLRRALTATAAEITDPTARLYNPAADTVATRHPVRAGRRGPVLAAAVVVLTVVCVVAVALTTGSVLHGRGDGRQPATGSSLTPPSTSPSGRSVSPTTNEPSGGPSTPRPDGGPNPVPLRLDPPTDGATPLADLPTGPAVPEPLPRVENPTSPASTAPVLVTAAGRTTLTGATSAWPLAVRGDDVLVLTHGAAFTGGGPDPDLEILLARPGREPRVIFHGLAESVAVSPDGARLAIANDLSTADGGQLTVLDVATGRILARSPGPHTVLAVTSSAAGSSPDTVVMQQVSPSDPNAMDLRSWQYPGGEPVTLRPAPTGSPLALGTPAGLLLHDGPTGCLERLDGAAAAIVDRACPGNDAAISLVGPAAPGGLVIPVSWGVPGADRVGALDLTTGRVTWWPVAALRVAYWLDAGTAVLHGGTSADGVGVAVRCTLSGGCVRIPVPAALRNPPGGSGLLR